MGLSALVGIHLFGALAKFERNPNKYYGQSVVPAHVRQHLNQHFDVIRFGCIAQPMT